jgi:hypothetical protein
MINRKKNETCQCPVLSIPYFNETAKKINMSTQLMREFEEFEGPDKLFDATSLIDSKEEDDSNFQPANAAILNTADIFYEVFS